MSLNGFIQKKINNLQVWPRRIPQPSLPKHKPHSITEKIPCIIASIITTGIALDVLLSYLPEPIKPITTDEPCEAIDDIKVGDETIF